MLRFSLIGIVASTMLLLLSGCGSSERIAESEIEQVAPRYIGPADRYVADVEGLSNSRVQSVQVTGYGVRPQPNLTLQSLTLTLTDVSYQRDPLRITGVGATAFALQATDAAMTTYLAAQAQQRAANVPVRNLQITFLDQAVHITGTATFNGQDMAVVTTGTLKPNGGQILYQPQALTINGIAIGEPTLSTLTGMVNPLVDLSAWQFAPQIQTIVLQPGLVTISGTGNAQRLLDAQTTAPATTPAAPR